MFSYRLSLVIFSNKAFEFLCQVTVLLAQFVVAVAVLLNLGLDVCKCVLKVSSDLLPLQIILTASLKGLLLKKELRVNIQYITSSAHSHQKILSCAKV